MKNNLSKGIKLVYLIVIFAVIIMIIMLLSNVKHDNNNISKVTKISNNKFDSVKCINKKCTGVIASVNNGKKEVNKIYNVYGKLVGKYTNNKKSPYDIGNKYILMKDNENGSIIYYLTNSNGKILYKSSNKINVLNNNYAVVKENNKYIFINSNGNKVYNNISYYKKYGKLIYIEKDSHNYILNSKMEKIIYNYKIDSEGSNYLILKNSDNNLYYYFDITNSKIIGDGFNNYDKKNLIIYKKYNNSIISYKIDSSGNREKIKTRNISNTKIDRNKYYIYNVSNLSGNNILVDNKEDRSFGVYNLESKKYSSIYKYTSDVYYSDIYSIDSNDNKKYIQISCSKSICGENKILIYNYSTNKIMFETNYDDIYLVRYNQYSNGYKVIKYSNNIYTLYDKNNKEIYKSSNPISVIDSNIVIGNEESNNLLLYLENEKKVINNEDKLAKKILIDNKKFYNYNDTVVSSSGNIVYEKKGKIKVINDNIFDVTKNEIKIYNVNNKKISTYRLKNNEEVIDYTGNNVSPFGGVMFINSTDKYIKVINSEAKEIKKIKGTNIYKIKVNFEHNKAFIITNSKVNNKVKYGLYLAK